MERKYSNPEEALNVAKEAVYLAWVACGGTSGMGAFQDRGPIQEREKVWRPAYGSQPVFVQYSRQEQTFMDRKGGW